MTGVVVAGGGPAAHRLAAGLVRYGYGGAVTVAGAEPRPAYNRALLGSVLDGTLGADRLSLPALPAAVRQLTGVRVTAVDRVRRTVRTGDGHELPYDVLVLATGARPRVPRVPGLTTASGRLAEGVRTVRTAADCRPLPEGPVVVLGGGIRGVESAWALRRNGHEAALVHPADDLMERHLDAVGSTVVAQWLTDRGVTLHLGRRAGQYTRGKVVLDDGQVLAAGTVLLCTGTVAETALVRGSGLEVREGVIVDDRLRTGDPHIHAIGDCAEHAGTVGTTVLKAWEQAEALARILTGRGQPYEPGRPVLRPRTPGKDMVVLPPAGPGPTTGTGETVSLLDRARGRCARLVLRGGRIHEGAVIGSPCAVTAVSRLYTRNTPVPADLLALLTGADGEYAGDGALPEEAVVCHCNNVTSKALKDAWHCGAHDTAALARATRATTGCGSCASVVRELCTAFADDTTAQGARP
ncbi:FAD-dependent oxidoreductase [Streptomyces acidicola]|uniref:NAD(P)/FAD-dependent oxidoreductase n=1 Tax=Streptomyces acidicola TaxID=2596892 RepID=A0A5N8X513_9ACTN|nr:FAD-dependent oxidoreductase [Streptomyces acidicola]MPY54028.1 NAD(P)/FAD-dependent oxidoreductase [Streptomyces acidicola]